MWLMLGISLIMNLGVYFYSDKIAIMSAGAKPIPAQKYTLIKEIVFDLAKKTKIPKPKLYISPDLQPNAFATGRNPRHSAVVVTEGLIRNLDREEIKGVLAHELSHVKNRDILIATVASVVASIITTIASIMRWGMIFGGGGSNENRNPLGEIFAIIFAPIAAVIIQLAISRSRVRVTRRLGNRGRHRRRRAAVPDDSGVRPSFVGRLRSLQSVDARRRHHVFDLHKSSIFLFAAGRFREGERGELHVTETSRREQVLCVIDLSG